MRETMSFLISTGIKMLLGLVFLGFLMIWVLAPTNLWRKNWLLHLREQTDSTYFGQQGANMLIYSVPTLTIAALSCVYLHLGNKEGADTKSESKSDRLVAWRRPVVTSGPLGVVSAMEFGFLCMFVLLLIWSFSTYLTISFADINKWIMHHHSPVKKWQRKIGSIGYYLGILGNICCAFLFYPVTRGSSILPVFGLTSEGSIKYHIWLGHMAMFFFTGHGLLFILYWALTHKMAEVLKWENTGVSNVAGELSLLFGLAMWVTVLPRIRRKKFELFFYAHQLYALFMLFYVLHVGFTFFCTILPGFYLFLIDRYLRFLQSRQRVRLLSARVLPCDTLELNFSKNPGLNYSPTSVMFINVPFISSMQWHPFTVSSNCNMEPDQLSVIIKSEGSWTQKLYQILSSPSPVDRLEVSVEGPYGPSSAPFLRHDTLVMVSGGSGITPFISIIRELVFRSKALKCPIPRAVLICAFKHSHHLTMLDLLLPVNGTLENVSHLQLQIEAFVTRDQDQDPIADDKKLVRTIWFKPNPLDEPISAVLGKQGWLWLAMIILTSFLMFVLIMGVLGRQYIYPIDHNTYEIYSYSTRAILNMLFICVFVILTASMATMWNKKQNGITRKQIQNMENATPTSSPSLWSYNADRELESLPHRSLTQDTKVHFGARPNLEKMLLECQGSSIGVLVSGPKEMRHEVARICASNLANRLHFEAISFNW